MPTSIALVRPYIVKDYPGERRYLTPEGLTWEYEPCKPVKPHRASWKSDPGSEYNSDPANTEVAEVIVYSGDWWKFEPLRGLEARYTAAALHAVEDRLEYDDEFPGLFDTLKEMAEQHPDAMWFVG